MNMIEYLAASGRTSAGTFYSHLVAPRFVYQALADFVATSKVLDDVKKVLFYGRDKLSWTNFEDEYCKPATVETVPVDVIHAILGVATEGAELAEMLQGCVLNGTPVDRKKLIDESGDVLWYLALLFRTLGVTFEEVGDKNIQKLMIRFPEKFTEDLANVRNLEAENVVFH